MEVSSCTNLYFYINNASNDRIIRTSPQRINTTVSVHCFWFYSRRYFPKRTEQKGQWILDINMTVCYHVCQPYKTSFDSVCTKHQFMPLKIWVCSEENVKAQCTLTSSRSKLEMTSADQKEEKNIPHSTPQLVHDIRRLLNMSHGKLTRCTCGDSSCLIRLRPAVCWRCRRTANWGHRE